MWYSYSLSTTTYSFLIISFILHVQQSHALRCKCNANRGVSQCTGNFCDIHNRDGKRAACGALRHARQTIFACVLIRRTSNDTYCHVIGSTTACWCREMDFCNADLEAELFDVDESTDNSDELQSPPLSSSSSSSSSSLSSSLSSSSSSSSLANSISNLQNEKITVESNLKQLARTRMNPIQSFDAIATTMKSVAESNDKQSMRRKINSAIEVDVAEKIKLTPQRENSSPTVIAEIISESGEYALDENDDGFQWQTITIPEKHVATISISSSRSQPTNSPKVKNVNFMDVFFTDRSPPPPPPPPSSSPSSITVNNLTVTLSTARTVLIDATPTTLLKALPDATIIPINAAPITNVIHQTTPSNDIIPSFDGKHETVSGATEVIPEMKSVNPVASDAMIPPIHDTATEMKSITVDSSLQSATAITSSPQIDGKFAARSHLMQHLKASQKTPNNDTVNVEWSNIQLKANSSITPIITYDQSVPKARLDQWKWEVNQQQPLINQSLIDSNSNDNRNATVNNSNTILLSTISLISSFLPLFVPQLISL